ncbi:MAG TPA: hypothetical protein VFH10_01695 [Nocardioides sp.]|uniref:hypothetical protein n=1 Tax=Nocardioides sp. TaxID=35761 RepID=UPI002D7E6871|nr:hypothetical protein [Nocardioides sp.]HET6651326.1 hypothetical protein [Nocardioides sp.]
MTSAATPHSVAVAWVEHLRAGGTTSWADWVRDTTDAVRPVAASDRPGRLPGAGQLELVRRLGLEYAESPGRLPRGSFTALADRALGRSGPGRGLPDLPLALPGADLTSSVGAPPTDPGSLPVDELIRHGVGLLADLLVDAGPVPWPSVRRRRVLARHAFHLAGAPVTTSGVRASLAAAGRVEGGWSPEVVLFAEPLDEHLAQVWSTRVQHGVPVRWETFAGRWARRDALPPSADLPAIASFWAAKVGAARVHVVVSDGVEAALPWAARVVGTRRPPRPALGVDPIPLSPAATDLLRQLNRVLNVRVVEAARAGLVRRAIDLLPGGDGTALALPPRHRDWTERRAERVARELGAGGYPVHGDLARIAPRHAGAAAPRRPDVLTLVLATCLRTAELETTGAGG